MTRRTDRVAEAIRRIASDIVIKELRDPRTRGFITITKVEVVDNLRIAKIYYSVLGDEKKRKLVSEGLRSAKGYLRRHIGDQLDLRYAIDISFVYDESAEHQQRIDEILHKIHEEEKHGKAKEDREGDKEI